MGTFFLGLLSVLFVVMGVVLVLIVLVQRSQGGGLSGAFGSAMGGSQTAFGAKTGDVLTWVTVGAFALFLLAAVGQVLSVDYRMGYRTATAPNAPSGLTAKATGPTSVDLTWKDESGNEDLFVVRRSLDGGNTWADTQIAKDLTNYTDGNLLSDTEYTYEIVAVDDEAGASKPSEKVTVRTLPPGAQTDTPKPNFPGLENGDEEKKDEPAGATEQQPSGGEGTTGTSDGGTNGGI